MVVVKLQQNLSSDIINRLTHNQLLVYIIIRVKGVVSTAQIIDMISLSAIDISLALWELSTWQVIEDCGKTYSEKYGRKFTIWRLNQFSLIE